MDLSTLALLVVVAFASGVGITAVGPGGVFLTVALFALTSESPATVVGTASATFVATGVVGTLTYLRSGELADAAGRRLSTVLSVTGLVGALLGVWLNGVVSEGLFALLLGGFVSGCGLLVWYRTRRATGAGGGLDVESRRGTAVAAAVGGFIGVAGGLLGVGGPVLAVPILVALGVPMLVAVAAAQVQSIFIAAFATAGYVARDAISPTLALAVGVPELLGVVVGWRVAHAVDADRLKLGLAALLLGLGPYVALSG